jgi:hypothetical protein
VYDKAASHRANPLTHLGYNRTLHSHCNPAKNADQNRQYQIRHLVFPFGSQRINTGAVPVLSHYTFIFG